MSAFNVLISRSNPGVHHIMLSSILLFLTNLTVFCPLEYYHIYCAFLYNVTIMWCPFYTVLPKYIKNVLCGTVVRVLILYSSDWSSNPPDDILNVDKKEIF